jgi:hypothetical protein
MGNEVSFPVNPIIQRAHSGPLKDINIKKRIEEFEKRQAPLEVLPTPQRRESNNHPMMTPDSSKAITGFTSAKRAPGAGTPLNLNSNSSDTTTPAQRPSQPPPPPLPKNPKKKESNKKQTREVVIPSRPAGPNSPDGESQLGGTTTNTQEVFGGSAQPGDTGRQINTDTHSGGDTRKEGAFNSGQGSSTGRGVVTDLRRITDHINPTNLQDLRIGETKKFFIFPTDTINNQLIPVLPERSPVDLTAEITNATTKAVIPGVEIQGILERQRTKFTVTLVVRMSNESLQYDMSLYGSAKLKLVCCKIVVLEQAMQLKPSMKCLPFPYFAFQHATKGHLITDRQISIALRVLEATTTENSPILFEKTYSFQSSLSVPDWVLPTDIPNGIVQMLFKAEGFKSLAPQPFINYLAEVNCGNSVQSAKTLPSTVDRTQASWKVLLSPADLGEGEWRVILRWNADPKDLDLHCKMSKEPFDVYFGKKNTGGRRNEAMGKIELDVDVTNGNGPETITFTPLRGRNYRFFVRNYTGARDPYSHVPLSQSGATLTVYMGNGDVKEFSVSEDLVIATDGRHAIHWNIFEIIDGTMHEINQLVFDELERKAMP